MKHAPFTVPLILFNANGSVRKTSQNRLAPTFMSKSNDKNTDASKENKTYVVDLMALMRVVTPIQKTSEDLALKLIPILPNQRISTG